jgi:uncharacterized protein
MDFDIVLALVAAVVGALVGLTGVGAGALMTPILIVFFGVSPVVAIATDLLYAAVTKVVGGISHIRSGGVQWVLLRRLWLGGVLGACVGVALVFLLAETSRSSDLLRLPLALVILAAAVSLLRRGLTLQNGLVDTRSRSQRNLAPKTVAGGAGIGLAVSLTSVGAGALGMALLTRVSPRGTHPRALVGTDLLFAVPLALIAGFSYFFGGLVDVTLLVNLLVGSIPGVLAGSALAGRAEPRVLNVIIGIALIVAVGMLFSSVFRP